MHTILNLNHSTLKRRIIITIYLIFNLFLAFYFTKFPSLLQYITLYAISNFTFADSSSVWELISSFIIIVIEIISIWSLFINKSKYKLFCNILLQIMCISDICWSVYLIIHQTRMVKDIFEIILDLIFILLITVDIIKTYKKPKNDTEIIPQ